VLDNLFYTTPKELDHFGHIVGFAPEFNFLVFEHFFFFNLALTEGFSAHSGLLFGVTLLFLALSVKVLLHPKYLLYQEVMMCFAIIS
jgi:membrane protein insertase Oxa1/YidC/SpoIIIJ